MPTNPQPSIREVHLDLKTVINAKIIHVFKNITFFDLRIDLNFMVHVCLIHGTCMSDSST